MTVTLASLLFYLDTPAKCIPKMQFEVIILIKKCQLVATQITSKTSELQRHFQAASCFGKTLLVLLTYLRPPFSFKHLGFEIHRVVEL
jgi:hypothetical protein